MENYLVIDTGLSAVVSARLLTVLRVLRRFIWRTRSPWSRGLTALRKRGKVCASVAQTKLAALVGVHRQRVNALIQELVALGWVEVNHVGAGRSCVYILGRTELVKGKQREVLFLDDWLARLFRREKKLAVKAGGVEILDLHIDRRLREVRRLIDETKRGHRREPVRLGGQEVSDVSDSEVSGTSDSFKREALEERTNVSRTPAALPRTPCRTSALKAVEAAKDEPREKWRLPALLGHYIRCWEERYARIWQMTGDVEWKNLHLLVRRVGMPEAIEAVTTAFKVKWLNNHSNALARGDFFERYVAPQVNQGPQTGEQAEWTGPRDGRSGVMSPEEFFRT